MPFTETIQESLINHIFGGAAYTRPTTLYLGLSTTTISSTGGNITEPAGNGYSRITITNNDTNFPAAITSDGKAVKTNGTVQQFDEATGDWGTISDWFLSTAASGGTIVAYGKIMNAEKTAPETKAINTSDVARFGIGQLEIRLAPTS